MNHDTAKKLNNAGFPYIQKKVLMHKYDQVWDYIPSSIGEDPMATDPQLVPTLSELIEACGDKFGSLSPWHVVKVKGKKRGSISKWTATRFEASCGVAECCPGEAGDGSTPEEAVANLWLALNKKK